MTNYQLNEMNAEVAQQFDKLIAERDALKAKLAEAESAIVNSDPDSARNDYLERKLADSEASRLKAEAACAELAAWVKKNLSEIVGLPDGGEGWHSPQEWEAVQAKMAAMREEIQSAICALSADADGSVSKQIVHDGRLWDDVLDKLQHALSADAGQNVIDYIAAARRLAITGTRLRQEYFDSLHGPLDLAAVYGDGYTPPTVDEIKETFDLYDKAIADVDAADAKLGGKP